MSNIQILIKPASSLCNLQCQYCFYCDEAKNRETASFGIMTEKTLENVVKKSFEWAKSSVSTVFQGGEPTLAGLSFYKKFIELQKTYNKDGISVINSIQTNACGLNEELVKFFAENNFLVGVSMDGNREIHDKYRKTANGKGSYQLVKKGIALLKKYKVEFNILCVVTKDVAQNIEQIYKSFRRSGLLYLQFIPCLQPFGHENDSYDYTLTDKEWGKFLMKLNDLWYSDVVSSKFIYIQQFDNYLAMLMGYMPNMCGMIGRCSLQNVIEADGSCYPCDFYVLDKYKLGNLNEQSFDEIYEKRKEIQFLEQSLQVNEECKACEYYGLCRGGCKRYCEPFGQNGERQKNILCAGYKEFFAYSYSRLNGLAKLLKHTKRYK